MAKITKINYESIEFDDGSDLASVHNSNCYEEHWIHFQALDFSDVKDLDFDLNGRFFEGVDDYGIRLIPINGHPIPVPAYNTNNGYYSRELELVLSRNGEIVNSWDITKFQTEDANWFTI